MSNFVFYDQEIQNFVQKKGLFTGKLIRNLFFQKWTLKIEILHAIILEKSRKTTIITRKFENTPNLRSILPQN